MRALATAVRLAGCFHANKNLLKYSLELKGDKLELVLPLDRIRLKPEQLKQFFDLSSAVRTMSSAEPLGLAPVVAQRLLAQLGGSMELSGDGLNTGALRVTLPVSP